MSYGLWVLGSSVLRGPDLKLRTPTQNRTHNSKLHESGRSLPDLLQDGKQVLPEPRIVVAHSEMRAAFDHREGCARDRLCQVLGASWPRCHRRVVLAAQQVDGDLRRIDLASLADEVVVVDVVVEIAGEDSRT